MTGQLTEQDLIAALRKGAENNDHHIKAALEHLITHDFWLRRRDFVDAAVRLGDAENGDEGEAWILWSRAREAFDAGAFDRSASSERFQLQLAIMVGCNDFRAGSLGAVNARMVVDTVAAAYGITVTHAPNRQTQDLIHRCRLALTEGDGHPFAAWSTGEQLAVALVLKDQETLDHYGYSPTEAAQRLIAEMWTPDHPDQFKNWLESVRAAVRMAR
jgi:hypothetical protein